MPITKNGNGQIVYSEKTDRWDSDVTGVFAESDFAVADDVQPLKQVKFNVSPVSTTPATVTLEVDIDTDQTINLSTIAAAGNSFGIIQPDSGTAPTADQPNDTLTLTSSDSSIQVIGDSSTDSINLKLGTTTRVVDLVFIVDGGGSAITTGIKGDVALDFAGTIQQVTLLADQSGSIVWDIWKDTYANYPPTGADSITASAKPTISATTKAKDSTLTGWTTSISAGDTLRFNIDSVSTIQKCTLVLKISRT
jgi:hypothetical protein